MANYMDGAEGGKHNSDDCIASFNTRKSKKVYPTIKGTFTSVWDGGFEVTTSAELDEETGEVTAESVDAGDVEILDREYFTGEDGVERDICPDCHGFLMREKCIEGEGNGNDYDGELICSNPYCDSNLF